MDAQKFGTFIAQCRKEKHMTQTELAKKLMITDKSVGGNVEKVFLISACCFLLPAPLIFLLPN